PRLERLARARGRLLEDHREAAARRRGLPAVGPGLDARCEVENLLDLLRRPFVLVDVVALGGRHSVLQITVPGSPSSAAARHSARVIRTSRPPDSTKRIA